MHCRWQFDPVVLVDPNEGITRRGRRSAESLMSGEEPNDAGHLVTPFRDERRRLYHFCAHAELLSEHNEMNFGTFE